MNAAPFPDTIIAPASAIGGGVAVIRVSGAASATVFEKLTGHTLPNAKQAQLVTLKHPASGKILDKALALYFVGPNSFTGEDVLELHVHGGRAVVDAVIQAALSADKHIRLASGGEFTKRAYLNGKIDLTEAEAIADLVAAETDAQRELALAQMGGSLRNLYEEWRALALHVLAYMEASIDFIDEEGVPDDVLRGIHEKIGFLLEQIENHLDDRSLGERLRDGFTVAVIGAPNAGKSSLVNALAKRDVAIVSSIAGTTRDAIEVHLNLGGYPVILVDTAGLRTTSDEIESEGIKRARNRAEHADIILALFDGTAEPDAETLSAIDAKTIRVTTKVDQMKLMPPSGSIAISTTAQTNLDILVKTLTEKIAALAAPKSSTPLLTRARHRDAVIEAQGHLSRALKNTEPELMTEDIRLATRALGKLTGRVDVEDLLDVIFRDFCIGK